MFGNKSQHSHMMAGVAKAAASPNTPPHLKAHLEKRMAFHKTGSKTQMKPKPVMKTNANTSALAESQIKAPPEPFRNPKGAANVKVGSVAPKAKKKAASFFGGR